MTAQHRQRAVRTGRIFGGGARTTERAGLCLLTISLLGMALGLGGAHVYVVLALAPLNVLGAALLLHAQNELRVPRAVLVLFGLALYSALQAVPVPLGVLSYLSPAASALWSSALTPFHAELAFGALSLDRGASLLEASKWFCYGLTFWSANVVAGRYGRHVPAVLVLLLAVGVASVTLVHSLSGSARVFGVYAPSVTGQRATLGPLINPNNLAGYLNLGAFCGLGAALSGRLGRYSNLLLLGVAVSLGVSILSGSRAGVWILPLGALSFVLLLASRRSLEGRDGVPRELWLTLLVALGLGFVAATRTTWQQLSEEQFEKFQIVRHIWPLVRHYFVFGVGRGAFESVFPAYFVPNGQAIYSHPENWLLQWTAEWGVPVCVAALLALFWTLRHALTKLRGSALHAGIATGVLVLVVQNFADLGVELAGVALALSAALGALAPSLSSHGLRPPWTRRFALSLLLGVGALLSALTLYYSRQSLASDRREVQAVCASAEQSTQPACLERVRAATLRHPAEAYFPRMGAFTLLAAADGAALPFLQNALERNPHDAQAHLLAAHFVFARGVLHQALLELRLAVTAAPDLSEHVGTLAGRWANEAQVIENLAPPGPTRARLLSAAAEALVQRGLEHQAELAYASALHADERLFGAHTGLLKLYARKLTAQACLPREACLDGAERHALLLQGFAPASAEAARLLSRVYRAAGDVQRADVTLSTHCPKLQGRELESCLHERFELLKAEPTLGLKALIEAGDQLAKQACFELHGCEAALLEIGDTLLARDAPTEALGHYERAALNRTDATTLKRIAKTAELLGRLEYAELSVDRAMRLVAEGATEHTALSAWRDDLRLKILAKR